MKQTIQTKHLLNLNETCAASLLEQFEYPWQALPHISDFIISLGKTLSPDEYEQKEEHVWIARSATVFPSAYITGPTIIGPNTEVRHCAFIRGNALVGANCVVGNSTELKNVILFNHVQVPHYNYVGDSILGYKAHMGAGSITSNVKSNKSLVEVNCGGEKIPTGLKKFGAILGDYTEIGCNSVLNPGSVIGKGSQIYPVSMVRGVVPEYHILELHKDHVVLTDLNDNVVEPEFLSVDWELNSAGKNGYPFYMEKEIMEQPEAIKNTIKDRIVSGLPDFTSDGVPDSLFTDCDRICVVACGTAMHAGLVAQALVKSIVHVQMDVELASEFMYSDPVIDEKTLVIAVSQSGETIDTLEALKYAKRQGAKCLSVINVKGSSIARESDYVLYTAAGPEIAVASTKAYTTQLSVFYLVVAKMALLRGVYTEEQTKSFIAELERVPEVMQKVLEKRRDIHVIAKKILEAKDLFMIGRGLDYSILLEGSLKLKEVSYIHSEAYASGELKHGPIALITTNTPVVATVTQEKLMSKELSNIKEVKSRGADIVLFIKEALSGDLDTEYQVIKLPDMQDEFMVLPASVALQLLAYYVSSDKGFDVDKPRNLAKLVTVE